MGESYVRLGQIKLYVNVPPATKTDGSSQWYWWFPSKHTGLSPQGGDAQLWGWSSNTQYISGLRSGLAAQAEKLGRDYANTLQERQKTYITNAPMPFLASVKNYVSGVRWSFNLLEEQYRTFNAQYGHYYDCYIFINVSGVARTNEANIEAWIDPESLTGVLDGPYVTGWRSSYNTFNPNSDSVKVFLSDGQEISGFVDNA